MNSFVRVIMAVATMLALITSASGCVRVKTNASEEELSIFIPNKALRGNGNLITKTIALPEFTKVSAHRAAEVTLVEKSEKEIVVTADENILPYVVITCERGVLDITLDEALKNAGNYTFRVVVPMNQQIDRLSTTSGATITLQEGLTLTSMGEVKLAASSASGIKGAFQAKEMKLDTSSGGEIHGEFRTTKIEMKASSASEIEGKLFTETLIARASSGASIEVEGTAVKSELEASSGAEIDAEKLTTTDCRAEASSGADIECHCTGALKASASSGASIYNAGNPASTEIQKSSGGSVAIDK